MTITLVATCLAVLVASVLGGIVPLATVLNHTRLQVYLSFSAGTMLGAAFFHMLPEAVRVGSAATIPWAAAGLLVLFFLERFFSFHHHEPPGHAIDLHAGRDHHEPHEHSGHAGSAQPTRRHRFRTGNAFKWPSAAFGLAVHSLVGGVALASAVTADFHEHGGTRGSGLRRAARHAGAQAGRRPDDLDIDGPGRVGPLARAPGQFRIRPDDPSGRRPVRDRRIRDQPRRSVVNHSRSTLVLSRHVPLHRAFRLLPGIQFHSHDRLKLSLALLAGVGLMGVTAFLSP